MSSAQSWLGLHPLSLKRSACIQPLSELGSVLDYQQPTDNASLEPVRDLQWSASAVVRILEDLTQTGMQFAYRLRTLGAQQRGEVAAPF
jgi:hypothetical protein